MILRYFPKPCPPPGWPNLIIHARGREIEYAEHTGPLSLKCVLRGHEIHEVGGVRYVVDEESALLLNHGRAYSSRIRPGNETETFSLFFNRDFARETLRGLTESSEDLLDDPMRAGGEPVEFYETKYPKSSELAGLLARMAAKAERWGSESLWLDEALHEVLVHLLHEHQQLLGESHVLAAARPATRAEQYRRLLRARDFIEGSLSGDTDLRSVASACFLSPFHLLRLFKQAFGETPHQYLTRRRLEQAHDMLVTTDIPVWRICQLVGYSSLGSFSNLVSNRYGASPREIRRGVLDS